jgi:murein DD-endopeptidase MepM/ murein hydrolase activator NlpD
MLDGAEVAAPAPARPGRALFGALIALPPELPPGAYELRAGGAAAQVAVAARSFPLETIPLNEANTRLKTEPSPRKDEEARRLYALMGRVDDGALFADGSTFAFPAEGGWRSAGFGDARRYLYPNGSADKSAHAGLDWAVVTGTAVRACARGRVAMAADREVTGKSIILEHLPGLYSIYFHLSALEVKEGDIVERGARIALSGSTGMSTGPHLHWELRARGEAVDPEYWLAHPLLDKAAVTVIMYGLIEGR